MEYNVGAETIERNTIYWRTCGGAIAKQPRTVTMEADNYIQKLNW